MHQPTLTCFLHVPQPHIDPAFIVLPYLWFTFKAHYDQNSIHSAAWNWIEPEMHNRTLDQWIAELTQYDSIDVVGISQYVWNHEAELHALCKWIKDRHPHCIIAFGGPQPNVKYSHDFFRTHSYVDVVCDQDGYGELFWGELLDQIVTNTFDPSVIPYAIYPDRFRMKRVSSNRPYKRDFQWYVDPYHHSEHIVNAFVDYASSNHMQIKASVEGTRGCPYTCTFCDWGGGTGTKVVIKPYDALLREYELLINKQVSVINIMDANLGIIPRDVDLVRDIIRLRDGAGHNELQVTYLGLAKADKRYVNQILDISADAGLIQEHFVSAQSFNDATLAAIRRTDAPWRQQMLDIHPLRNRHPSFVVRLQVIIGLPETSIDDFYEWFDAMHQYNASIVSAFWLLLPATPAYDPAYVEKYGLTIRTHPAYMHTSARRIPIESFDQRGVIEYPIVVESTKYTTAEWEEMLIISQFMAAAMDVGWLPSIISKLSTITGQKPSVLYRQFITSCIQDAASPLNAWYMNQLNAIQNMHPLDAYSPPTPDGYLYCGEAYWIQMMSTDANWMPITKAWANRVVSEWSNNA